LGGGLDPPSGPALPLSGVESSDIDPAGYSRGVVTEGDPRGPGAPAAPAIWPPGADNPDHPEPTTRQCGTDPERTGPPPGTDRAPTRNGQGPHPERTGHPPGTDRAPTRNGQGTHPERTGHP